MSVPYARPHRWVGVGWFPLTWIDVAEMQDSDSGLVEFSEDYPQFHIGGVFCVTCDRPYSPDNPWCSGLPPSRPNDHHYVSLANFLMTDEEAQAWLDDSLDGIPRPRTLLMACWFCGEIAGDPMSDCPERAFWIDKDWQGSWTQAGPPEGWSDPGASDATPGSGPPSG